MPNTCQNDTSSNRDRSEKDGTERPSSAGGAIPRFSNREILTAPSAPAPGTKNNNSSSKEAEPNLVQAETATRYVCIYCGKVLLPGPQFVLFHLTVCPVLRCPPMTLEFHKADLMQDAYQSSTTVLAQVVDCASMRPFGVVRVTADKYPFSNPYSARKSVGAFNWACPDTRSAPGTLAIYRSKKKKNPIVVNMFSRFYKGQVIEHNALRQNLVSQLRRVSRNEREQGLKSDDHFIEGLERDTQENRVKWLQQCLQKLARFVLRAGSEKVVFPYVIGSDLSLDDFEKHHVPAIKNFFDKVSGSRINVVVLNLGEDVNMQERSELQDVYEGSEPQDAEGPQECKKGQNLRM
ncbi:uncharacterized protein [Palaemon carinicauda]|uniref:uncharacterized protein isoform X2 n=1 Tax=Palaemon carinicauda TaxID=392227 RepID=UPI0035B5EF98